MWAVSSPWSIRTLTREKFLSFAFKWFRANRLCTFETTIPLHKTDTWLFFLWTVYSIHLASHADVLWGSPKDVCVGGYYRPLSVSSSTPHFRSSRGVRAYFGVREAQPLPTRLTLDFFGASRQQFKWVRLKTQWPPPPPPPRHDHLIITASFSVTQRNVHSFLIWKWPLIWPPR